MSFNGDLKIVVGLVVLTAFFTLLSPLDDSPVRIVIGIPIVLFLPGYALVAALFPRKDDLDGIERVALSFGLSIAVVPLIGFFLNYTLWGIRLLPILLSLSVFTLVMVVIAIYRRRSIGDNAFTVPFRQIYTSFKHGIFTEQDSRFDRLLTVTLLLLTLVSVLTAAYVAIAPNQGEKFTEFYILGSEGMAENYDTQLQSGESVDVIVGVVNHEYTTADYSLQVRLDNESLDVPSTFQHISLNHNESWEQPLSIVPSDTGSAMKLEYLLYKEGNFGDPYRDVYLWINVTEAGNAN